MMAEAVLGIGAQASGMGYFYGRRFPVALSLSKGAYSTTPFDKLRANAEDRDQLTKMTFWVYILRCGDGSYYVGHSEDLEVRIGMHQSGDLGGYTARRRPVELVFSEEFPTREEALESERRLKGWSRRKKEALIAGDWSEVSRLARGRNSIR